MFLFVLCSCCLVHQNAYFSYITKKENIYLLPDLFGSTLLYNKELFNLKFKINEKLILIPKRRNVKRGEVLFKDCGFLSTNTDELEIGSSKLKQ